MSDFDWVEKIPPKVWVGIMWIKKKLAAKRTPPDPPRVSCNCSQYSPDTMRYLAELEEYKKTANTIMIRVDRCSGDYWYKDCVGQTFEVVDKGNCLFDYTWVSGELPTSTHGHSYAFPLFVKEDCSLIMEPKREVTPFQF